MRGVPVRAELCGVPGLETLSGGELPMGVAVARDIFVVLRDGVRWRSFSVMILPSAV
jgi:hypothetical protein